MRRELLQSNVKAKSRESAETEVLMGTNPPLSGHGQGQPVPHQGDAIMQGEEAHAQGRFSEGIHTEPLSLLFEAVRLAEA